MKEEEIGNTGLKYADTVDNIIKNSLGKHRKDENILILPNGLQILPLLNI
ncbi:MAG: hypothetical protein KGD61_06300 [Candidatus Lokiarchaeota archaeon]|nr:hypothetical protein [Candidatus Lokiarchaeota archaeon]